MSAAPGRIKADMRIELERPRDENNMAFNELEKAIKGMVLAEARMVELGTDGSS
jgi:hypothetical protein